MAMIKVLLSFHVELLQDIDRQAEKENINRSDLIREAARQYLSRKRGTNAEDSL